MSAEILNSDRSFQVWGYTISHRELLFRSTKSKEFPTRIGVFLKGVRDFHLPTNFDGLAIEEAAAEDFERISILRKAASLRHQEKVFILRGGDFVGYVVALGIWCHEDEGEYYDASFFPTCIRHGVVPDA